ncbi:nitroreductase [Streptomyces himastatinicus ATCC 53653]|uniref:Putative NAD(P)H nitroreductase n=1 Tax=Streptomyces himastatinicus ATCC 53653 TaxID=457427 RepID=D9WJ45_9ACTN|nr:nitroreductase family protein [Streptomyces himastatinicus]EFL29142.1 nitroreductase [Streptomyces himastatinicus ATCC 53653]
MELTEAVLTRRSQQQLTDPAPDDEQFTRLLRTASAAPDHGRLRPWRWVLLRGGQRARLGRALAAAGADDAQARAALKPLRAPLLASIVFVPRQNTKVPRWEQLAATAALVHCLELLLHDHGWGSIWRTGHGLESPAVHDALRIRPGEQLLGWLYIGTPHPHRSTAPKPVRDVHDTITRLGASIESSAA